MYVVQISKEKKVEKKCLQSSNAIKLLLYILNIYIIYYILRMNQIH